MPSWAIAPPPTRASAGIVTPARWSYPRSLNRALSGCTWTGLGIDKAGPEGFAATEGARPAVVVARRDSLDGMVKVGPGQPFGATTRSSWRPRGRSTSTSEPMCRVRAVPVPVPVPVPTHRFRVGRSGNEGHGR
jgi:hypothetical protein